MDAVVFDTETTGLSPRQGHRIIEIGAVKVVDAQIVAQFSSLIDSGAPMPAAAQAVHGISAAMLRGQPAAKQVFTEFRDFIGDHPLVAHNAVFDMRFLRAEFDQLGCPLPNPSYCTLKLMRKKYPRLNSYKLEAVSRYLFGALDSSIQCHRALDDAMLAARIWLHIVGDVD
ncbi:MAG: 3'-5' exonuclease [Desulfuromonas sp.]|nr:3'-5' exonuclease [Desulfuromonas sp.]